MTGNNLGIVKDHELDELLRLWCSGFLSSSFHIADQTNGEERWLKSLNLYLLHSQNKNKRKLITDIQTT